jgi:UDP-2,3-diacylglucosamine hydrolase
VSAGGASSGAPVGLVAGSGRLPFTIADAVRGAGRRLVVVAHQNETDPALEAHADQTVWVKLGQLGKIRSALVDAGVKDLCFAGGLRKVRFFRDARPDALGLKVLAKVATDRGDDRVLRAIAGMFEEAGMTMVPPTDLAPGLLAPEGVIGKRKPTKMQQDDIDLGLSVVRALGRLDIGQAVVVKEGVVLAVEAADGTDAAIRRGCELGRGGVVVVKAAKPGQDLRFDQPAVGPLTIETLVAAGGGGAVAVEAGRTILVDREALVRAADAASIALVGV